MSDIARKAAEQFEQLVSPHGIKLGLWVDDLAQIIRSAIDEVIKDIRQSQLDDTKQLDWLESTKCEIVMGEDWPYVRGNFKTIREAIDAAMKRREQ